MKIEAIWSNEKISAGKICAGSDGLAKEIHAKYDEMQ